MRPRPLPLVILAPLIAVVALSAMPSLAADSASVFMYHRFGESDYAATNIRIDQFEAHLAGGCPVTKDLLMKVPDSIHVRF